MSNQDDLEVNVVDDIVSIGKGIVGIVPIFGPMIGEVIGQIIPRQRIDRITEFIKILDVRLSDLEMDRDEIAEKMSEEAYINLFEEGIWQAARSSSQERKEYIASLLTNGLTDEALNDIQQGVLLSLLGELNDIEILKLYQYTIKARTDEKFQDKHLVMLAGPHAHMGSGTDIIDQNTVHQTYKEKLIRLGLLNREYKKPKRGEFPEFDEKTGMIKEKSVSLTPLGRLLLKYIDMGDEF